MQIIQSLLGTQVNPLGQKSYLGYQHQISSQSNKNYVHQRNSNFIKPLVTAKPLFPTSKLFLARKRQPFIDTLFADGYDLDTSDVDTDFSQIKLETLNFPLEINTSYKLTDIKFDISNISNFIQTQITNDVSNEILIKTWTQAEKQANQKLPTKKLPPSKSVKKTKTKQADRSSISKRKPQINDETPILPKSNEINVFTTDNLQTEIYDNSIIQASDSEIATINNTVENNKTLNRKANENSLPITNEMFVNSDDYENEKILNRNHELNIDISNSLEYLALKPELANSSDEISITKENTNQKYHISNKIPENIDNEDISFHLKNSQIQAESTVITQQNPIRETNENAPESITLKTEANVLHSSNILEDIIKYDSNTGLDTKQNLQLLNDSTNKKAIEIEPLASETILPKSEDKSNLPIYLDNTQEQSIVANVNYSDTEVTLANEDVITPNTINTLPKININNQNPEYINNEFIEFNAVLPNIETQSIDTSDITSTTSLNSEHIIPEANIKTQITSSNKSKENTASLTPIQPSIVSSATPKVENLNTVESPIITPVATSNILPQSEENSTQQLTTIQGHIHSPTTSEIEDINTGILPTITPVSTSHISLQAEEISTPELVPVQPHITSSIAPEIEDINTEILPTTTPVSTSHISSQAEEISTPELVPVQPHITSSIAPEIEDINTTELTIMPVSTSDISLQSEEVITPEITSAQNHISSSITPEVEATNTAGLIKNKLVYKSDISPESGEVITPEIISVQPHLTSSTTPEIEDSNTTILPKISPVVSSHISSKSEEISTLDSDTFTSEIANTVLTNPTENLLIIHRNINNEQIIASESDLVFNNLDLSNLINDSDTSENILTTYPSNNTDNTANIDIEPATLLNDLPAPKGYATGGQVNATSVENHQPVAPSDTVPAMLTPGEFVINAKDAQKNLQILKHINIGGSPEEVISPSLEVTPSQTPETNSLLPTTKVDSFVESPIQRQSAEPDTLTELTPLSSPSLGVEVAKQRRSLLNHPQDTMQNTTHVSPAPSPQYSSPSLIFRKTHSTTNTQTPSQWSSVEELLNANHDEFTNFNFGCVEGNWQNSPSSQFASSSTPTHISTKRFSQPQGYANGGEVLAPDISRDIAPITETIKSPDSSLPTAENDDNEDGEIEALAQAVYYRLRQRIEIEKERQGIYVGRLPW
ncbi:hypothetical protein [Nostoc sp. MS1]|uniref:hypothetical protein n=1 Tax=Nostoc sp. MS1 TaxID=2764711 RepID=UPI001CC65D57|nr:hypothetical protein [Nostoc sp. MS1]BCL35116.1 hypothetical protein NSMS1_15630 [Nostoc sp. MS1]